MMASKFGMFYDQKTRKSYTDASFKHASTKFNCIRYIIIDLAQFNSF